MNHRKQLGVYALLLAVYALMPFLTYTLIPLDQITAGQPVSPEVAKIPTWQLGLMNSAIVLVIYGLLGVVGYLLACKLGLPGIYREGASRRDLFVKPLLVGLGLGVVLTGVNGLFNLVVPFGGSIHPTFPLSIFASISAGIGEEIMFRLFVMCLWAFLLNLVFRRWAARPVILWVANIIAALAFAAGHLPTVMILTNITNVAEIPPLVLVEVVVLNGLIGLVAGRELIKNGLVAAIGIHLWTDVIWHIILPLFIG